MADAEKTVKLRIEGDAASGTKAARDQASALDAVSASAAKAGAGLDAATSRIDRMGSAAERLSSEQLGGVNRAMDAGGASAARYGAGIDATTIAARKMAEANNAGAAGVDRMVESAARAAQSVDRLGQSATDFLSESNALRDAMQHEAKSLDDIAERRDWYRDALQRSLLTQREYVEASKDLDAQEARIQQQADRSAASIEKLAAKYDPAGAAAARLADDERRLEAAWKAGEISQQKYEAALHGLAAKRAQAADATGKLVDSEKLAAVASDELKESLLGATGAARPFIAVILEGGAVIAAVVATLGAFAYALIAGAREQREMEDALIATGNAAGVTGGQIHAMAGQIDAATGLYGKAHDALAILVQSGRVAEGALDASARATIALAEISGESIEQAAGAIIGLADRPSDALATLNQRYHFLTASVYEQIVALEKEGDTRAAQELAANTAAAALEERRRTIVENAGYIEQAWTAVKESVLDAWEALKGVGRTDDATRLNRLYAQQFDQEQLLAGAKADTLLNRLFQPESEVRDLQHSLDATNAEIAALEKKLEVKREIAEQDAKGNQVEEDAIVAAKAVDAQSMALDRAARKQQELNELASNYAKMFAAKDHESNPRLAGVTQNEDGTFSGGQYDRQQAAIIKRYTDAVVGAGQAQKIVIDQGAEFAAAAGERVAALQREVDTYGMSEGAVMRYDAARQDLSETERIAVESASHAVDALNEKAAALETADRATQVLGTDILAQISTNAAYDQSLLKMTDRQRVFAQATKQASDYFQQNEALFKAQGISLDQYTEAVGNAALGTFDLGTEQRALEQILSQFDDASFGDTLIEKIGKVEEALRDATDPEIIARMQGALENLNHEMEHRNLSLMQQGVSSLQRFAKEGTAAYTALGIAQDVLAYKSAIAAIANQGSGDPYTAFARIAAMIALMASIGIRVGGGGGGGGGPSSQSAEARQAVQGTGSVLGDAEAKSESISHAVEITAQATTQLVGINRGMLSSLQALQSALGAAGVQLARGVGDVEFTRSIGDAGNWNWLSGGDSKLIDEGIIIAGGRLQDMLNDIVIGAYQTVETSGGWFHSDDTSDEIVDVSDEFGRQFQLVIGSIIDTVREGALALGLLPADIEAAIAAYEVAETRISLKDLSADEKQAELEAVFSQLFDGLAGAVVPFIDQFQQVGEGLGETLIRVATEVQVTQEAFRQLGLAVDETDPERFAQIADDLVQVSGGLEDFIGGMQSFTENFASEGQKFQVDSAALTSALSQVGLTVPATRDGMWALMQSLDATNESGREQIATLLRLADVADQYYDALGEQGGRLAEIMGNFGGLSEFGESLQEIRRQELDAVAAANALAQAQGRAGASAIQLATIHRWALAQEAAAIRQLENRTDELQAQLYDGGGGLDALNARIAELEGGMGTLGGAITDAAAAFTSATQLLIGDLSPYSDRRRLEIAKEGLLSGDVSAEEVLQIGRRLFASSTQYGDLFDWVMANRRGSVGAAGSNGGGQSAELADLIRQRDALTAEQTARERGEQARQYAQNISDLATVHGVDPLSELANRGVGLGQLASDFGADLGNLDADSVLAIGELAATLHADFADVIAGLGLGFGDLRAGMTQAVGRLGIDLAHLNSASVQQLAFLANSMSADLADVGQSLGVDLGDIGTSGSLANQALGDSIDQLPDQQRDVLEPLFDAVVNAATAADANAAIDALEDAVNAMAPDVRNLLAPYLEDVFPADALSDLDYLADIRASLGNIDANIAAFVGAEAIPLGPIGSGPGDGFGEPITTPNSGSDDGRDGRDAGGRVVPIRGRGLGDPAPVQPKSVSMQGVEQRLDSIHAELRELRVVNGRGFRAVEAEAGRGANATESVRDELGRGGAAAEQTRWRNRRPFAP